MQCIFDYQEFDEDVSRWVYVFIGRLFFDLGELDNWQVAMFLEGVAGSGKSTITKIVNYQSCANNSQISSCNLTNSSY